VDLVESDGKASEVCQRNADLVNTVARHKVVTVHRSKVDSFLDRTQEAVRWDLVFLDPPYPLDEPALAGVLAKLLPHLAEGAVVVVERSSRTPEPSWPDGMERFAERKYGETKLWFAEPGVEEGAEEASEPETNSAG
jgi:16S rRNA (guanine966-N2)-methyltransferase